MCGCLKMYMLCSGERVGEADVGGDLGELAGVAERLEHRVEVVHGVADLVDAQRLVL